MKFDQYITMYNLHRDKIDAYVENMLPDYR
jgi:hypothetical protein